jgi:uncharacterized protein (DUF39 family)
MVKTASMSSLFKARKIAAELKEKIISGQFVMTRPVDKLPFNPEFKPLNAEVRI